MALGNSIILAANPRGVFLEGIATEACLPGVLVQLDGAVEPIEGRYTWELFNGAADGERILTVIVIENKLEGGTSSTAYAAGDRLFMYVPCPGEHMNVMVQASAGALVIGTTKLIVDDSTGEFIITTGSPESEPFMVMETLSDPSSDTLVHVMATGQ